MNFSYLDKTDIDISLSQNNAGLYTGNDIFLNKPWGPRAKLPHIIPDAAEYCKYFYAKTHIPSYQTRPGNNELHSDLIKEYNNNTYLSCST